MSCSTADTTTAARDLVPALAAERDAAIRAAKVEAWKEAASWHEREAAILALIGEGV